VLIDICDMIGGLEPKASKQQRWQVQWLAEIAGFGPSATDDILESQSIEPLRVSFQGNPSQRMKTVISTSGERRDSESLRAGLSGESMGVTFRTKAPGLSNKIMRRPVYVQGPLHEERLGGVEGNAAAGSSAIDNVYCSMVRASSDPPTFVCATSSGKIKVLTALEEVEPRWQCLDHEDESSDDEGVPPPSVILFEQLIVQNACNPWLEPDPLHRDRLHMRHDGGVHELILSWLEPLESYVRSSATLAQPLPELVASTAFPLLDTRPLADDPESDSDPAPLIGFSVITEALIGYVLLAIPSTTLAPIAINLTTTYLPQLLLNPLPPPSSQPPTTSTANPIAPFESVIEPLVSLRRQAERRQPIVSSQELSATNERTLEFLNGVVRKLKDSYVSDLYQLHELIESRTKLLCGVEDKQKRDLSLWQEKVHEVAKRTDRLKKLVHECKRSMNERCQRAEKLLVQLYALNDLQSNAEKDYERRIQSRKNMVDSHKAKLAQLARQAEREAGGGGESPVVDARQLSKIKYILDDENSLIASTINDLRKLEVDVGSET